MYHGRHYHVRIMVGIATYADHRRHYQIQKALLYAACRHHYRTCEAIPHADHRNPLPDTYGRPLPCMDRGNHY